MDSSESPRNFEVLDRQQDRARRVVREVTARGTSTLYAASEQRTVRSDGKPVRLTINTVELPAEQLVVAAPAVSLNAVRVAHMQLQGDQPLLPSRVSLYLDEAFSGATTIALSHPASPLTSIWDSKTA